MGYFVHRMSTIAFTSISETSRQFEQEVIKLETKWNWITHNSECFFYRNSTSIIMNPINILANQFWKVILSMSNTKLSIYNSEIRSLIKTWLIKHPATINAASLDLGYFTKTQYIIISVECLSHPILSTFFHRQQTQ